MTEQLEAWPAGQTATMNVTYTQANAAGGAVVCEITPGAGNEFIILAGVAINSGTNSINIELETATSGTTITTYQAVASGASTSARFGVGLGSTTPTTGGQIGFGFPAIVSGTQSLRIRQLGAGAQNDTFQVLVNVRLKTGQIPTVTHANSTNPANVSVTSGAESFTVV